MLLILVLNLSKKLEFRLEMEKVCVLKFNCKQYIHHVIHHSLFILCLSFYYPN